MSFVSLTIYKFTWQPRCSAFLICFESISFALEAKTPAAYIEVKNVGKLGKDLTRKISCKITDLIHEKLGVPASRTYIEFQESERHLWGWNGKTFG